MTIPLRYLVELNPRVPEFDALGQDEKVGFLPLEAVWSDSRADHDRVAIKADVSSGYTRYRAGDVVVPKVTPTFQAGRSMIATKVGAGTTELHILRPRPGVDPRWVCYAARSQPFLREGVTAFQGVAGLQRIPPEFVNEYRVADKEPNEQRRIVEFLDDRVSAIDEVIAARQQQKRLIREAYKADLQQSVDAPDVRRRPLQVLTDPERPIQYGIVLPGHDFPGGVPIVKGGDVGSGRLARLELNRTDPEIEARYRRSRVHPGDFVIAIRGSYGEIGVVPSTLEVANLTQDTARIAPINCDPQWLAAALESPGVQSELEKIATGATIKGVNIGDLRRVPVPVPSWDQQRRIGKKYRHIQGVFREHSLALARSIDLLTEYKSSLITAAVTGELDVTTAGSNIPG